MGGEGGCSHRSQVSGPGDRDRRLGVGQTTLQRLGRGVGKTEIGEGGWGRAGVYQTTRHNKQCLPMTLVASYLAAFYLKQGHYSGHERGYEDI